MSQNKKINIGLVGATGMVGTSFLEILKTRKFPLGELRLFASDKSVGNEILFNDLKIKLVPLVDGCFKGLDLVFFSSGDVVSLEWAPKAALDGAFAVDNSAAFRMNKEVPLIVPEVNGDLLDSIKNNPQIIANPNCTTIQLVVALSELHKKLGLQTLHIASYQAVSGAGIDAYNELLNQIKNQNFLPQVFPHPIAYNCIPQIGSFFDNGFTGEEVKIMNETKKILRHPFLKISAFTVRVPVLNAHAEVVWAKFQKNSTKEQVLEILNASSGVRVQDDPSKNVYPQQYQSSGLDPVFVGRIHQDLDDPSSWIFWIVADNIRKGAALNGVQIAERIFDI